MTTTNDKYCPKCKEWKVLDGFYKNKSQPDGHQNYCIPCWRQLTNESRNRHLEARKAKQRETQKAYYAAHPEECKARTAEWYAEKGLVWHQQRRQENPEYYREATRRWQQKENNSGNSIRRRRANKVGNGGNHTEEQWQALAGEYNFCCAACGRLPSGVWPDVLTRDHIVPLILGGTHDIENIQPLCLSCNTTKNRQTTDYRRH